MSLIEGTIKVQHAAFCKALWMYFLSKKQYLFNMTNIHLHDAINN